MDVSVHHELQTQPQLPHQLGVPLRLLDDWVDQHGLLGVRVSQEVGVGGGLGVKQLSEYHADYSAAVGRSDWLDVPEITTYIVDEPNQT